MSTSLLADVETPAAVVDLDALEANIRVACALASHACGGAPGVTIRPHFKAHKSVDIARFQIALSGGRTVGMVAQKLHEVAALVEGGVLDVLLSNEVVHPAKIARLALLARRASISVLVDDADNVRALAATAAPLGVLVEIDVGQGRCGVADAAAAVALGRLVREQSSLTLRGIQCYHGAAQHVRGVAERRALVARVAMIAREVKSAFVEAGLPCDIVTGGGTGTFWMEAASGVFTELQPGSYALCDADYSRNMRDFEAEGLPPQAQQLLCWAAPFAPALFLLSQVMSRREGQWCVLDSGLKAQSVDSGPPQVVTSVSDFAARGFRLPHFDEKAGRFESATGALAVASVSDEHTTLKPSEVGVQIPAVGELLLLMPGHVDPFMNHFDSLVAIRKGVVEGVWNVARGPGL